MTITEMIKDYALNNTHIDKIGIAGIERFNESPEGCHPTDFLPGCKSVVAFCIGLPIGAVNATMRTFEDERYDIHGIYGAFGYVGAPNFNLMWANYKIARYIEKVTGKAAMPETAGPTHGGKMLSMRHCAYAAGLGEFGWNSVMMTPEFGPRNRFGAVLTLAELDEDPMYSGPKLCDPSKCHVCEKMCPTGAIPPYKAGEGRLIESGGKTVEYCGINWAKCKIMCHGLRGPFNETGKDIYPNWIEYPLDEEITEAVSGYFGKEKNMRHNFHQHSSTWKCGNCIAYCPAGDWNEKFGSRNLSDVNINKFIDN